MAQILTSTEWDKQNDAFPGGEHFVRILRALDEKTAATSGAAFDGTSVTVSPTASSTSHGLIVTQSGHGSYPGTDTYNPNGLDLNGIYITSDDIDSSSHSIYGLHINHKFGGPAATGQRLTFHSWLTQTAATSASAADDHRYYQAGQFTVQTNSADGGTNTAAGAKGAYIPINTIVFSNGANALQLCSTEFDVFGSATATQKYVMGISICSGHINAGVDIDAAIDVHCLGAIGSSPVYGPGGGFTHGIRFQEFGGLVPIRSGGTVLGSGLQDLSAIPVTYGVDLNNFTFSQKAFRSPGFSVAGAGQTVVGAGTTGQASLNIPAGVAPTSYLAGDIWNDGKTFFASFQGTQPAILATKQMATVLAGSKTSLSNSSVAAQSIFASANDTLTLAANTAYRFRGWIMLNTGTTSHTTSLGFSTSISADGFHYTAWAISGADATLATPQMLRVSGVGATVVAAASTAATTNIWVEGFVRVIASGTITPQITFSAGPTGTCEVVDDSFFEFEPLGTHTFVSVGPWS